MKQIQRKWIGSLIVVCAVGVLHASNLSLQSLLDEAAKHSDLSKAIEQETLSLAAKRKADTATDPLALYLQGTRAYPDGARSGNEYAVGASKTFKFSSVRESELSMLRLSNEADLLEGKRSILNFRNGLKRLYHQHCLDKQNYRAFKKSYDDFMKLYEKKQKAYRYQEISKTELLQLETEKNKLYATLVSLDMEQEMSRVTLSTLSNVPESSYYTCNDLYPIRSSVALPEHFALTKEAYIKRMQSAKEAVHRYSQGIDSVNVSAQYTNEIDTDRYSIGVSIPLNFGSEKYEQERAAAMYRHSAVEHRLHQILKQKRSQLMQLKAMLKSQAFMVNALTKNYKKYKQKVLPLIQRSYVLGEVSVIEFLLGRQKLYQLQEEIFQTKKAYYNTLFNLYSVNEQKDQK